MDDRVDEVKGKYDFVDIVDTSKKTVQFLNFFLLIFIEYCEKGTKLFISALILLTIINVIIDSTYKHLFYKAECDRRESLFGDGFGVNLTPLKVVKYYSNDEKSSVKRLALDAYESAFTTKKNVDEVTWRYAVLVILVLGGWFFILQSFDNSKIMLLVTQIIFSSSFFGEFIDYFRFKHELDKFDKKFYNCFTREKDNKNIDVLMYQLVTDYECLKSNCNVSTSTKIFLKNREKWKDEWKELLNRINDN